MNQHNPLGRFTDQRSRIVTQRTLKIHDNESNFRCGFCGYKFQLGDYWRWQYTNDTQGASGNPYVCAKCDKGPTANKRAWAQRWKEYNSPRWWWFRQG